MLYFTRPKLILISIICVLGFLYTIPNLLNEKARTAISETMPSWFPQKTVNLGLDLQGGSHILLEVDIEDVIKERSEALADSIRPELRSNKIGYTGIREIKEGGAKVVLRDPNDFDRVKKIIRSQENGVDITISGKTVEASFTEAMLKEIRDQTIEHSIETVRRRVDETGTREPVIQRQGDVRILVQLPGIEDPSYIKELLGKTAKLSFHLLPQGQKEIGSTITLPFSDNPESKIEINKKSLLGGDRLVHAAYCADRYGKHAVCFRFDNRGAKQFCNITRENTGKPFAIVLDGEIITAPNINEPICGGRGQISGSFTTTAEANDLALLLRAGALPAPLNVIEERTVGPSLGSDSVEAGKIASLIGMVAVIAFMIIAYGKFGIIANIALFVNVALIFAVLSILQATLTLPGIAGIVLTIGMAVDANVLIFERIKEELKLGRSPVSAIDAGYKNVMSTITDANFTTLIATFILFSFGTGPIKGFAVTLAIGIITSLFSAIMVTRMLMSLWVFYKKPKELKI